MDTVLGTSFTATQAEYQRIHCFRISESFQRELSPCLTSLRDVKSHKCFSSHSQVLSRIHELFPAQSVSHILTHLRTLYMHILHLRRRLDFLRFFSAAFVPFYVAHGRISWSQGMQGKRIVLTPWYTLKHTFRCKEAQSVYRWDWLHISSPYLHRLTFSCLPTWNLSHRWYEIICWREKTKPVKRVEIFMISLLMSKDWMDE